MDSILPDAARDVQRNVQPTSYGTFEDTKVERKATPLFGARPRGCYT